MSTPERPVWYFARGHVVAAVPNKPVPAGATWWTREGDAEWKPIETLTKKEVKSDG